MTTIQPDHEAELAILSSIVDDERAAAVAFSMVTGLDFTAPWRAQLFILMRVLFTTGSPVELISLRATAMKSIDPMLRAGYEKAIQEGGFESVGTPANIELYCNRLRAISLRRAALEKAQRIAKSATDGTTDTMAKDFHAAGDVLEAAEARSAAVCQGTTAALDAELEQAKRGERYAIPFPWPEISRLTYALLPGTCTVLCGSPGASKSLMLLESFLFWHSRGVACACLELEDGTTYHMRRALAQLAGNSYLTRDDWCKANPAESDAAAALHKHTLDTFGACLWELHRDEMPTMQAALDWLATQCRRGKRIIAIDPYTLLDFGDRGPSAEKKFFIDAKRMVEQAKASLILVTHPRKSQSFGGKVAPVGMDDISGSTASSRFVQTVLWLQSHDFKTSSINLRMGITDVEHNRTVLIMKARNSIGARRGVATRFEAESLRMTELGGIA